MDWETLLIAFVSGWVTAWVLQKNEERRKQRMLENYGKDRHG